MVTPAELIELARFSQAGRYVELERSARTIIARQPGNGAAWKALAVSLQMQSKQALPAARRATELSPSDAETHYNLGIVLLGARQPDEAMAGFRRALMLAPAHAPAHIALGDTLRNAGRTAEAAACYRRALEINPRLPEVHNILGHVLCELGQPQEALESCARALQIDPGFAAAHNNLGNALQALGRTHEAEASYRRALAIDPALAEVHSNLAEVLLEMGRVDESVSAARVSLQLNPRLAEAHENLANALLNVNFERAVAHYRAALEIRPHDAELNHKLGMALRLMGCTAEAEASYHKALELSPGYAPAIAGLAEASADRGEFGEAETLFRQALQLEPDLADAWVGLSRLRKFNRGDASWLEQAERLANRSNRPKEMAALRYAIGKYFDDIGDYDQAFRSYQHANDLSKRHAKAYDRQLVTGQIDELIARYDQPLSAVEGAVANDRALLIVGMPRSGTSLAEQILASHPSAFGAGELTWWHSASARLRVTGQIDDRVIHELGVQYQQLLAEISAGAARVIDKMPTNFLELGLILSALAGARVIHMQRDPIDTCLSIYFQDFRSTLAYANGLDDLAHFYQEYDRLMRHWRKVVPPGVMLEVPYEGLVEDQEGWTRRMLDFTGLPWDPRCLDFHQTQRSVVTASKWQVRQQISRSSVARWRHYQGHIAPLLALAPTAV